MILISCSFRTTLVGHTDNVICLAALPMGELASASADKTIRIWNPATSQTVQTLSGHTGPILALAVLPNGELASGSALNSS